MTELDKNSHSTAKSEAVSQQSSVATQLTQKNNMWIVLAVGAAFVYSLGNVAFGIGCSEYGITGAGLPGPSALFICLTYRLVQACVTKSRVGTFVDYQNSHWWVLTTSNPQQPVEAAAINDENF